MWYKDLVREVSYCLFSFPCLEVSMSLTSLAVQSVGRKRASCGIQARRGLPNRLRLSRELPPMDH